MNDTVMQPTETTATKSRKLGNQVESVTREVRELGRVAGEDARQKLDDARDRLMEAQEEGERVLYEARTRSREAIENRPFTAVAVAAGLGALVAGILLKLK